MKLCLQPRRIWGHQECAGKWLCLSCEAASDQRGGRSVPDLIAKANLCWHYLRLVYQVLLGEVTSVRKGSTHTLKDCTLKDYSCQTHTAVVQSEVELAICRHHLCFHHPIMKHLHCTLYLQCTSHCINFLQGLLF